MQLLRFLAATLVLLSTSAAGQSRIDFVGVKSGDKFEEADRELLSRLETKAHTQFNPPQFKDYGDAIRALVGWKKERGPYLARMTPYAYVAAEMLGADFEVIGMYRSVATGATTYRSYFVVRRKDFPTEPRLENLLAYLREQKRNFMYHDKFSTSSYFLPSLYFRSQRIFSMEKSSVGLTAIDVTQAAVKSSSFLVQEVAAGHADFAAVWDGTKASVINTPVGNQVWFVPLPTAIPNDLLVCSAWLDAGVQEKLHQAVAQIAQEQKAINLGDFQSWEDIHSPGRAQEGRAALVELQRAASAPPAPVTVLVQGPGGDNDPAYDRYLRAARQAIRLSGTEFEVFEQGFHQHVDVVWTLKLIHDGAIVLTSNMKDSELDAQTFQISFNLQDLENDLAKRLAEVIASRLHRIRYIWPYEEQTPTIVRDVNFSLSENAPVQVQRISWKDPGKNDFEGAGFQKALVDHADFYKFTLKEYPFPRNPAQTLAFDPLSNEAYQVILVRPSVEKPVFKVLVAGFVLLLLAAGGAAAFDMRRKSHPPLHAPSPLAAASLDQTCRVLADESREAWRDGQIAEANVVACDRVRIEEIIAEMKVGGLKPEFDAVTKSETSAYFGLKLPFFNKVVDGGVSAKHIRELIMDPGKVGNAARLASLIPFLIRRQQLSQFTGDALEWRALNRIARLMFSSANGGPEATLLRPDDALVLKEVSNHFNEVYEEAIQKMSFFSAEWKIVDDTKENERYVFSRTTTLPGSILIGSESVQELNLEFRLKPSSLGDWTVGSSMTASLLGNVEHKSFRDHDGKRALYLRFSPAALLKT